MLPSGSLETFGHGLLPRAKSGSMVLWRPGSGVVSVIPVGIGRSIDVWGLVGHLGPCWCHVGACGPCCCWGCADLGGLSCHQDLVTSRPELHSRSMVLLQLGSMVMSMACVSIKVIGTMAVLNCPYHDWLCLPLSRYCSQSWSYSFGENSPPHSEKMTLPLSEKMTLPLTVACTSPGTTLELTLMFGRQVSQS